MNGSAEKKRPFKVVIVGGGIAGLTLANSLESAKIDYVLLEAHSDLSPQVGASIGIFPSGGRVIDQLGLFDKLESYTPAPKGIWVWVNGKLNDHSFVAEQAAARHGYGFCFIERRDILRLLYERLVDKSKALVNSRVSKIDHSGKGVVVHCENGEEYAGDIVVGADGVHSVVREEMRRYADGKTQRLMEKDKKSLSAEYTCLFGIATPVPGIEPGTIHRAYNKGFSFLVIGGKTFTYFFAFKKLDKRHYASDIPRFSKDDAEKQAQAFAGSEVAGGVSFSECWKRRTISNLVPIEEAQNEHWVWGRFVCVGDSIAKVTPNAGYGGNAAIESAAVIANCLHKLLNTNKPSASINQKEISATLEEYHNIRKERAEILIKEGNNFTRLEAFDTTFHRLLALYFLPNAHDLMIDSLGNGVIGASKLDFLPAPKRTQGINMPFNASKGIGKSEPIWKRIIFALPLLAIAWAANTAFNMTIARYVAHDPIGSVPMRTTFTGFAPLDNFVSPLVGAFTPSMAGLDSLTTIMAIPGQMSSLTAPNRLQMLTFLADLTPVIAIWTIESCRRGNYWSFVRVPLLFGYYYQRCGIGLVGPIYYFLHYIQLPPTRYHALDNRLVRTSYAKTLLPALLIGYVLPTYLMYNPSLSLSTRQSFNYIWQFFPLWVTLLHGIFARCVKDTTEQDKISNVTADLPHLRTIYALTTLLSSLTYLYTFTISPTPFFSVLFGDISDPSAPVSTYAGWTGRFLRYDYLFCFLSGAVWILLCFWDLKRDKRISTRWGKILGVMGLVMIGGGPGSMMGVMWWWREEILADRKTLE